MIDVLAIPNDGAYVIKKEYVEELRQSKTSDEQINSIVENAKIFVKNNLKQTK